MKQKLQVLKKVLFTKKEIEHSEQFYQCVKIFNKYSWMFHILLACAIIFVVELVSRRNLFSAIGFIADTPITYRAGS